MTLRCRAADLPVVAKAWRAGRVDARKVAVIGEQVSYLDPATAQQVAAEAVDYVTETWSVPDRPAAAAVAPPEGDRRQPRRRRGTPATSERGPAGAHHTR